MLIPAEHYNPWVNEVLYTTGSWLDKAENREIGIAEDVRV